MTDLDLYCERLVSGMAGEPINLFSNVSFFLAFGGIFSLVQGRKISLEFKVLVGLILAIGAGSSLFHTFATRGSQLLDVIPIFLFQVGYLWLYFGRVVQLNMSENLGLIGIFLASSYLMQNLSHVLNGSLSYLPGLIFLTGLGIYHYQQQKREHSILLLATGVFIIALFFRTIDLVICPYFAPGTHFLWHLLNGWLLYLLARALIVNEAVGCREEDN